MKERVTYLGFDPFIAWHDGRDAALELFVKGLLPSGVRPLVDSWATMDAVAGEGGGGRLLFVLNLEAVPADFAVRLDGEWSVKDGDCRALERPGRFEAAAYSWGLLTAE